MSDTPSAPIHEFKSIGGGHTLPTKQGEVTVWRGTIETGETSIVLRTRSNEGTEQKLLLSLSAAQAISYLMDEVTDPLWRKTHPQPTPQPETPNRNP